MNYFAHALPFLDDPYFAAGTAVPDWLTVADRPVRVRTKHAGPFAEDDDPQLAAIARGLMQHIRDDRRFHETRVFAETTMELSATVRRVLGGLSEFQETSTSTTLPEAASIEGDTPGIAQPRLDVEAGYRASFVGHLLVEMLLDAVLVAEAPARLEAYYGALESVDARVVQQSVNRMAMRSTERLAPMIFLFCRERILWDYLEDDKLWVRLNQVMRRVGFAPLPAEAATLLPAARRLIACRRKDLMEGIPD